MIIIGLPVLADLSFIKRHHNNRELFSIHFQKLCGWTVYLDQKVEALGNVFVSVLILVGWFRNTE